MRPQFYLFLAMAILIPPGLYGCGGSVRHVVEIDRARATIAEVKAKTPGGEAQSKLESAEEMLEQAIILERNNEYDRAKDSAEFSIRLAEESRSIAEKKGLPSSDTKLNAPAEGKAPPPRESK